MPPPQRESPGRESEASQSDSAAYLNLPSDSISGDARHEGFNAGYALGKMERFELEVEDYARALLHDRAREMLGFAGRLAAAKGPAWEAMIIWSGASDE